MLFVFLFCIYKDYLPIDLIGDLPYLLKLLTSDKIYTLSGSDMKTKSIKKYRSVGGKTKKKASSKKGSKKGISKRKKLTTKQFDKILEKECEDTICTKYVKEDKESTEEFMGEVIKNLKKMSLEDPDVEKRKIAKKSMKNYITEKKRQSTRRYLKKQMEICKKIHCNPTCDGTVVDGIVEDGFNKKMHPMDVKELKRDGAISGCLPLLELYL